jgi:hypothetical protein
VIRSHGGRVFRVAAGDDEVVLEWADPYGQDGDALLSPDAARDLAAWLTAVAALMEEEAK